MYITVDGVEYIRKDSLPDLEGNEDYSIIRTQNAGVHFGHLASTDLSNATVPVPVTVPVTVTVTVKN